MKNDFRTQRERFTRFNQWEEEQRKSVSTVKKLDEFLMLFNLAGYMKEAEVRKEQDLHLENWIMVQARLMGISRGRIGH